MYLRMGRAYNSMVWDGVCVLWEGGGGHPLGTGTRRVINI